MQPDTDSMAAMPADALLPGPGATLIGPIYTDWLTSALFLTRLTQRLLLPGLAELRHLDHQDLAASSKPTAPTLK